MENSTEQLNGLYKEVILELYRHPLHKKIVEPCDMRGRDVNTSCGDEIELMIRLDKNIIADIGHQGNGCAISQAAVSLLADHILGKNIDEIKEMKSDLMNELLPIDIPYTRKNCAMLGWNVLQQLLSQKI